MGSLVLTSGDSIYRGANLPSPTNFSMCGWFKATSALVDYYTLLSVPNVAFNEHITVRLSVSNGFMVWSQDGGFAADNTPVPGVNVWLYAAVSCSGTGAADLKGYLWDATGALTHALTEQGTSFTAGNMYFGTDFTGNFLDGRVGRGRVWDAVLSQSEFEAEMFSEPVVRTTDFNSGFVDSASGVDPQSGRTWTHGGSVGTDADTPPLAAAGVRSRLSLLGVG